MRNEKDAEMVSFSNLLLWGGYKMEREFMEFDVVIVGAGPAGLSASIKLMQQANANQQDLNVCVIDKGSEVGAHILSGGQ